MAYITKLDLFEHNISIITEVPYFVFDLIHVEIKLPNLGISYSLQR